MQSLSGSVGNNGSNQTHDIALVQALLTHAQRSARDDPQRSFYLRSIHGSCDAATKAAITLFQRDHQPAAQRNAQRTNTPAPRNPPRTNQPAPSGVISPGDAMWLALVAEVPGSFQDLRVLSGSKIVYIAASAVQLKVAVDDVDNHGLRASFAKTIKEVITDIHAQTGVAISVCPNGGLRTFDGQLKEFLDGDSNGGPGESPHCFGLAVDVGYSQLAWLTPNGTVIKGEDSWLHKLARQTKSEVSSFQTMMRSVALKGNRTYIGPPGDFPHLQSFHDSILMSVRLAALLTSARNMQWEGRNIKPHGRLYRCDLGYGGAMFEVGSSVQIWGKQAPITTEMLNQARGIAAEARGAATAADVTAMQEKLRKEFEWAERNRDNFTP